MKNLILFFASLSMIVLMSACGETDKPAPSSSAPVPASSQVQASQSEAESLPQSESSGAADNTSSAVSGEEASSAAEIPQELTPEFLLACETITPETDFTILLEDGEIVLNGYKGKDAVVVVPDTVRGMKVTEVASYVFGDRCSVKAIRLPDSITEIDDGAFGLNKNLEVVVLGKGLEELGSACFLQCEQLKAVVLPEGLEKIGEMCFYQCANLKEIEVPSSVKDFGTCAFDEKTVLVGTPGSPVEAYAAENGYTFRAK